jgi:integrase
MDVSLSFILKEPKSAHPTLIYAFLYFHEPDTKVRVVKVSTGLMVAPQFWDKAENRARTKDYAEGDGINADLTKLKAALLAACVAQLAEGNVPTAPSLRSVVQAATRKVPRVASVTVAAPMPAQPAKKAVPLLDVYDKWLASRRNKTTENTLKTNRTARRQLVDFQDQTGYLVSFETMTSEFLTQFVNWLLEEKELKNGPVRKYVMIVKHFLTWATDQGYNQRQDFRKFTWQNHEPEIIALTKDELAAIESVNLKKWPGLDNTRAWFLIGCYTGLRWSDVIALKPGHIKKSEKGEYLHLITQKTRQLVKIPIRPKLRPLLDRLVAGNLKPVTNQLQNRQLKTVAEKAGVNEPIHITTFSGAQRRDNPPVPKYELICTHTARRSFVSLSLAAGAPPEVIRQVTGHKTVRAFERYVSVEAGRVMDVYQNLYGNE